MWLPYASVPPSSVNAFHTVFPAGAKKKDNALEHFDRSEWGRHIPAHDTRSSANSTHTNLKLRVSLSRVAPLGGHEDSTRGRSQRRVIGMRTSETDTLPKSCTCSRGSVGPD